MDCLSFILNEQVRSQMSLPVWLKPLPFFLFKKKKQSLTYFSKDNAKLIGLVLGLEFPVAKPKCPNADDLPKVFENIKLKKTKTWNITQETAYLQHHSSIYLKCLMFSDEWDWRWIASACLAHPLSLLCSLFSLLGGHSVQTMSTGSLTPWFLVDSVKGRAIRKSGRAESSGYNFLAPSLWGCWGLAVSLPSRELGRGHCFSQMASVCDSFWLL